jgi:predicted phosphate transport protein (TIGR00153 family)
MAFRLRPSERGFFPLFTQAAENIVVAAEELARLVAADAPDRPTIARLVKAAEDEGDRLTHEILTKLNSAFVTPFDREDIHRLASALDDVCDAIEEAADRIVLYRLGHLPPGIAVQVDVLCRAALRTAAAMPGLEKVSELHQYTIDVNSLEDEGDAAYHATLAGILSPAEPITDPAAVLEAIKLKEVVDTLEDAADAFEAVGNTVESIAVKES